MDRYLLFDSRCGVCARLAAEVSRGPFRIETRPLSDLDMQGLLEYGRPGAGWEPTLLEVEIGVCLRVFTGARLRIRLVQLLGLLDAWRLWRRAVRAQRDRERAGKQFSVDGLVDSQTRRAIGATLMSPAFRAASARLASTRPLDAWWEPDEGCHVVTFRSHGQRGVESLLAFVVDADVRPVEIAIEAGLDGWQLTHVASADALLESATVEGYSESGPTTAKRAVSEV